MDVIAVHVDRCVGCKTCELACAVERGSEGKTLLSAVREIPQPQARVRVEGGGNASFPIQCRHCLDAPCLDACLTGALARDGESGLVRVNDDRCIGCWTCVMFCPYGVIFPWPERKLALKCDRCMHMESSACVDSCPTSALEIVNVEKLADAYAEKRRSAAMAASEIAMDDAVHLDLGK
ncbi:MAG: 4Fe-4S dicluster domain-containing protein [Rhodospirillales bacterium]|jgi:anaerobic carbon-monoxide dehydrogenase iron sulfur subunit|nr:4Fe-4S dicluster domain-containing protein [Rhodospirillales bacterium]